jgi:rhodanese-related sulfurtransferase
MRWLPPQEVKPRLTAGGEIAFLDIREHGQYGEGHPFFAVPLPYSRLEIEAPRLLPRKTVPIVLLDDGDGVAEKAARRLAALGYTDITAVESGAPGWSAAGYMLFKGVNVPSKAFGEIVEHACGTPHVTAENLQAMRDRGEEFLLLDGRTVAEYRKMNIPGGIACPNAELGHRLPLLVPDEQTPIVINCAGRTRSIMGAQSLIELGFRNPVYALENGTQGWQLAGYELEHGANRFYPDDPDAADLARSRRRADAFLASHNVPVIDVATLGEWQADRDRSLYLLDVRTAGEFAHGHYPGTVHAPGGQLVQATDQWVAVRGARLVLTDDTNLRAAICAYWLRQMGHDAVVLDHDVTRPPDDQPIQEIGLVEDVLPKIDATALMQMLADGATLLDLNGSMAFRRSHIEGARWAIRPRLDRVNLAPGQPVVLTSDEQALAEYAALDLRKMGCRSIHYLTGTEADWRAAGLTMTATPDDPPDAECIDYLFFVHDRHAGNLDACRQYLAWETGLLDQMDEQEKSVFRVSRSEP